jgi:hypothetical protein
MIRFTCYKKIAPATNPPSTFPKYIYRLTPFDPIDSFVNDSKDFVGKNYFLLIFWYCYFFTLCFQSIIVLM